MTQTNIFLKLIDDIYEKTKQNKAKDILKSRKNNLNSIKFPRCTVCPRSSDQFYVVSY